MAVEKVYKTIFQVKRGQSAAWFNSNPILRVGEPGFEIDTGKLKIGDGVTAWNDLNYLTDNEIEKIQVLESTISELKEIVGSEVDNTGLFATINEKANIENVYTKSEIDNIISSVYVYKGTVNSFADLPIDNLKIGDVYNIEQGDLSLNILPGDNVVWNGEEWDKLAGLVDLSSYITKDVVEDEVTNLLEKTKKLFKHKKFEILGTPKGTLIQERESEIRVFVPSDAEFVKQSVGATGNPNMYYMQFRAYAPDNAASFKEGDRGVIVDEMFTFNDAFAGVDEFGRKYSVCWLALASYDANSDTWTYFGKNSTVNKFIGWSYVVEWYDENGDIIFADSIRINLSNENCHSSVEPYYLQDIINESKNYVDEQLALYKECITVVEF